MPSGLVNTPANSCERRKQLKREMDNAQISRVTLVNTLSPPGGHPLSLLLRNPTLSTQLWVVHLGSVASGRRLEPLFRIGMPCDGLHRQPTVYASVKLQTAVQQMPRLNELKGKERIWNDWGLPTDRRGRFSQNMTHVMTSTKRPSANPLTFSKASYVKRLKAVPQGPFWAPTTLPKSPKW